MRTASARMGALTTAFVAALLLTADLAGAQAYRWVDENGKTHFADTPPPDRKADKITIRPQVAEDPQAAARHGDWQAQLQESGVRRLQDQTRQDAAQRQAKIDEYNCRVARNEVARLQSGRVYRYGEDGQKQYLADKDRPAALQAAQDRQEKYCR